jgi:DNA ligase-1
LTIPKDTGSRALMLAKKFEEDKHDPKGWLFSEKLDGVRCYWNGKVLYSRNGNKFYAPKWFLE